MKTIKRIFVSMLLSLLIGNVCAQEQDSTLYVPYQLNYLPAGSPVWMARLASPEGLDYNAMVDSFEVYLHNTPGARHKSRDTKQVVNHFRRFQKAYLPYVQADGIIRLPKAADYHKEMDKAQEEVAHSRALARTATGMVQDNDAPAPWKVISPIVTYDYLTKKVSPAQSNIQRMAASRSNPNVLYCGSETGMVFRSTDKG